MFKKVPFSLLFLSLILLISALTQTITKEIHPSILKLMGFSVINFSLARIYTIITMLFLVSGPLMLLGMLLIIIGSFFYEYIYGTKKAIFIFFATHFIGIIGLYIYGLINQAATYYVDLGASIGFWGMSGAVVGKLKYKEILFTSLVLYLIVAYLLNGQDVSNIEHPISFIAGMVFQKILNSYGQNKTKG